MCKSAVRIGVFLLTAIAAAAGSARADFDSGFIAYIDGAYAAAYTDWLPAAEDGHVEAQFGLAMLYFKGQGTGRDLTAAAHWFGRAAEQGSMRAQTQIGAMYARGEGVEADWATAIAWWRKAAAQGSERAQYQLGQVYEHGTGLARDLDEAARWYGAAAARGYAPARQQFAALKGQIAETTPGDDGGQIVSGGVQVPLAAGSRSMIYESPDDLDTAPLAGEAPLIPLSGGQSAVLGRAHRVYLASFRGIEAAETGWRRLVGANRDLLGPLSAALSQVDLGRDLGVFYRLQAGPIADGDSAEALCLDLIARSIPCVARRPQ